MSSAAADTGDSVQKLLPVKKICLGFQSEDKRVRKKALLNLQDYIHNPDTDLSQQDLKTIFNESHIFVLSTLRDKSEAVRSQGLKFMTYFLLERLPKNDYYLTYVFPVLVERLGTAELVEESEEIRLECLQFLQAIITKYSESALLKAFLNDCISILAETVKDKYPEVKKLSCKCITALANALPQDFHMQAESLVKPVLSAFSHQQYKVRMEAIICMGDIVMHSTYKGLEEAVGPMAERLFDQIPAVRQAVVKVAALWLLEYKDRYSYFHKILPLILTGLNDEIPDTRTKALQLWKITGLQYEKENEKDLKDKMDYLLEPPKYYPENLERPNLGCRDLVQRNVGKIAPALARELGSWQNDVKVRCSQLLCSLVHHAEEGLTQHLQELLCAMYFAAQDENEVIVLNIIRASEFIGLFVPVDTWLKLILPAIEDGAHFGHLRVLAGLVRGAPQEYVQPQLEEISKLLADDDICRSRKNKYQQEMMKCVDAILSKCQTDAFEVGRHLFIIIVTVVSIRDVQNQDALQISLLDDLRTTLGLQSCDEIWSRYLGDLLTKINVNPEAWTTVTVERLIFENVLVHAGYAFGEHLPAISDILEKTLNTDADPESRLRTFVALSSALDSKDYIFKGASKLNDFLQKLLADVLVPTLVWHAGRTAEAMRTIAASCLCSALNPGLHIDLFESSTVFQTFLDKLLPLLLSLVEDASFRSRQLAIEALTLLKETATKKNCWSNNDLIKTYPEIMKRLDDPTDSVRIAAIKALPIIFRQPPEEFTQANFRGHHELIIDTLLTHFDDDDEKLQDLISECLKEMVHVGGKVTLMDKIHKHKPLLRNQAGCERIIAALNE